MQNKNENINCERNYLKIHYHSDMKYANSCELHGGGLKRKLCHTIEGKNTEFVNLKKQIMFFTCLLASTFHVKTVQCWKSIVNLLKSTYPKK